LAKVERPRVFYLEDQKGIIRRLIEGRLGPSFELQFPLMLYYILE